MPLTNYPQGLSSFGIPVYPSAVHMGTTTSNGTANIVGNTHYWVNGSFGSDGNDGLSPASPKLTMAAVFLKINSGDIIHMTGNIAEQVSTPAGIFDVTIVGEGNQPRHSDAHTTDNGYTSATWKSPSSPTAATPLLLIRQQGWKIMNILFDGPSDAAAIQIFRDAGAGDSERDGSHAWIAGNKFVAAQNHIEFKGGPSQVVIEGNLFFGSTGASFLNTVGAGVGTNNYYRILNNVFMQNVSHIIVPMNYGTIMGNVMGNFTTTSISLAGGSQNVITMNYLYGTYSISGGYTGTSTDEWGANMNSISGGWTAADPA